MFKLKYLLFLLVSFYCKNLVAQPFAKEIAVFKKADSISFPKKKSILFVGSSSFTLWKDVQNYFPNYRIINRGFGGSTLVDVIDYNNEIIKPYKAKQIVIYCGENDFAANDTVTVDMVFERFKTLFTTIRNQNKKVHIAYVSMKPSPSRKHLMKKYELANTQIEMYLKTFKRTAFIDVYHAMLNEDGNPMPDIFKKDNLHMNEKGYAIWKKLIEPVLLK